MMTTTDCQQLPFHVKCEKVEWERNASLKSNLDRVRCSKYGSSMTRAFREFQRLIEFLNLDFLVSKLLVKWEWLTIKTLNRRNRLITKTQFNTDTIA